MPRRAAGNGRARHAATAGSFSERRRTVTIYDPGPEDLYPMLRAENAEVLIHPSDRKYGALLVGGQGTGKSSARCSPSTSTTSRIPTRRRS